MRQDLQNLYEALTPSGQSKGARSLESRGAVGMDGVPGATPDHVPLLPEQVDQLEHLLKVQPDAVCEFLSGARGGDEVTPAEAQAMIDMLRKTLEAPAPASPQLESLFSKRRHEDPPAAFSFDLHAEFNLPINVARRDFEDSDWVGYGVGGGLNGALHHANLLPLGRIRRHTDYDSRFRYDLTAPRGRELKVALFADFANGYYHAQYIAKRIQRNRYPYAVHLGDVYYAGTEAEVKAYLEEPLRPALEQTELFLLAGNHEMYAKGRPWLDYIDRKRHPERQRQEGTYFRLVHDKFQLVGIDTEWFGHMRYQEPMLKQWLDDVLTEGRSQGRTNILLSSNEPYCYGKNETTPLHEHLRDLLAGNLVDLWFWGNTHYAALFRRSDRFPFIGSCIGHGGYPYKRIKAGSPNPVPTHFLEDGSRFGGDGWTDPRPDMGNNGFCELSLNTDGTVGLVYLDWRGRIRHDARLGRKDGVFDFLEG